MSEQNETRVHPGRLVMVDIPGKALDSATAAFLRDNQIRAVCLFRKNLGTEAEVRALIQDLRALMGPTALIGLDQEGGSVVRSTFLPQAPSAMALGASGDEALAEGVGAAVAALVKTRSEPTVRLQLALSLGEAKTAAADAALPLPNSRTSRARSALPRPGSAARNRAPSRWPSRRNCSRCANARRSSRVPPTRVPARHRRAAPAGAHR